MKPSDLTADCDFASPICYYMEWSVSNTARISTCGMNDVSQGVEHKGKGAKEGYEREDASVEQALS